MKRSPFLPIFCSLVLIISSRAEAKAYPHDSQEVAGISIGGLHTGIKTNLFSKNGPLDQLDKGLNSGLSEISKGVGKVSKFMSQGSQEEIAGVNIAGLHAGLKTNLFSKHGPLAVIGNELEKGAVELHRNLEKGADVVASGVNDVANEVKSTVEGGVNLIAKGFEDLGNEASSASSQESDAESKTRVGGKETITIIGKDGQPQSNSLLTGGTGGAGRETITITGRESGQTQIGSPSTSGASRIIISGQSYGQPDTSNSQVTSVSDSGSGNGAARETISITGKDSGQPQTITGGSSRILISGQTQDQSQVTSGSEGTPGGRSMITINGKESEQPAGQSEGGRIRIHYLGGQENGNIMSNLDGEGGALIIKTIRESGGVVNAETLTELLKKMKLSEICKAE